MISLQTQVLKAFDDMPRELIAKTGLEHVVIFHGEKGNDAAAYVTGTDTYKAIYARDDASAGEGGIKHELYHLVDEAECPDIQRDDSFAGLGGDELLYNGQKHDTRGFNYGDYENLKYNAEYRKRTAITYNDRAAYCEADLDETEFGEIINAYADYHPNVAEDKADIGGQVLYPEHYEDVLDPKLPILRKETIFLFGRLLELDQNSAKYLAAISSRPNGPEPIVSC